MDSTFQNRSFAQHGQSSAVHPLAGAGAPPAQHGHRSRGDRVVRPSDESDLLALHRNGCSHVLSPTEWDACWALVRAMRGAGVDEDPEPEDLLSRLTGDVHMRLDGQARTALSAIASALAASTAARRGHEVAA